MSACFHPVMIDDSPRLLEQSYQLRYQVYCLERHFLPADDYPNQQESDEFDRDSIHVGVVDANGDLAATARIITAGMAGLPLLRHCTLFPLVTALDEVGNTVVEVSRVSISRNYSRRRRESSLGPPAMDDCDASDAAPPTAERRQRRGEPFVTLLHAIIHGARHLGATHLMGATDPALHRWLVHYGFPYRVVGPEVDYYGLVAPHLMSLADLDEVILGRQFAALDGLPVGSEPSLWPRLDEHARAFAGDGAHGHRDAGAKLVDS